MWILFYILGAVIAFVLIMYFEWKFITNKDLRNLTAKEWFQDIALSFFSWVTVALALWIIRVNEKTL